MSTTQIGVRMDDDLLAKVDALAAKEERTRTNMVIVLIKEALALRDKKR